MNMKSVSGFVSLFLIVLGVEGKELSSFIGKTYIDAHVDADYLRSDRVAFEASFDLVSKEIERRLLDHQESSLSPVTIKKMELFSGGEDPKKDYVGQVFSELKTYSGKAWAVNQLARPVSEIKTLQERQAAIAFFAENKSILEKFSRALSGLKESEKEFLLFKSEKKIHKAVEKRMYFSGVRREWNSSELAFEYDRVADLFLALGGPLLYLNTFLRVPIRKWTDADIITDFRDPKLIPIVSMYILKQIYSNFKTDSFGRKIFGIGCIVIVHGVQIGYQTMTANTLLQKASMVYGLQKDLIKVAQYINGVQELVTLVKDNPQLLTINPKLSKLFDLEASDDYKYVYSALKSKTFQGAPSYSSQIGKVLKVYRLLPKVMDEFAPLVSMVGELDCYVALAEKFNHVKDQENKFCFAQFKEKNNGPLVEAQSFWNPVVRYHKDSVVSNDFRLGENYCQNMVVTGPNTSGKSTILKGVFLNVLLAQTFGMAAADTFILTPFHQLHCSLNPEDNTAAGVSLFKAEVLRAKELISSIENLKEGQYSFLMMDELFGGTSPDQTAAASCIFAKKLVCKKNAISMLATHYPEVTKIDGYINKHVEVIRNQDGSLTLTHKLQDGPTYMSIAKDILQQYGLAE